MTRLHIALLALPFMAACATTHEARGPDGGREHVISCGWLGWYICYDKANEICPAGFKVLSEQEPSFRKELRIACSRPR